MFPLTKFTVRAWACWSSDADNANVKHLPPLLRRRVTALGRNALSIACTLPELDKARYIFSSRHGEFSRTLSILTSIAEKVELSPADFSLSVHHALISLLSIAQGNRCGHIAVAGGDESFCSGLVEALACLAEKPDEPVLLIHCDEPLQSPYSAFGGIDDAPIVIAILLGAKNGEVFTVQAFDGEGRDAELSSIAVDFIQFLNGEEREISTYSRNERWHWERHGLG